MTSIDYYVKWNLGGVYSKCPECGKQPRFISLSDGFKTYCKEHARLAMSNAGKVGGKIKQQWNKGETKETNATIARQAFNQMGEKNPFFGKKHSDETMKRIKQKQRVPWESVVNKINTILNATVLSDSSDYVTQNSRLKVKCNVCSTVFSVTSFNVSRCSRCKTCFPIASRPQLEVADFVKSLGFDITISDRTVISPYELDVFVSTKSVAIEYHGLYWHSGGKNLNFDENRHLTKRKKSDDVNVYLIQLFADEWEFRRPICEALISRALGTCKTVLDAQDCELVDLDEGFAELFVNENHVAGCDFEFDSAIGLRHPELDVVAVALFNGSRIERVAFLNDVQVNGGIDKLAQNANQFVIDLRLEKEVPSYFKFLAPKPCRQWFTDCFNRFDDEIEDSMAISDCGSAIYQR